MHTNTWRFLRLQRKTMFIVGLWPIRDSGLLYKIITFLSMTFQYTLLILIFIYMIFAWGDIEAMSLTSCFLLTHMTECCQATAFVYNHDKIQKIVTMMDIGIFKANTETQEKIIKKHSDLTKSMFNILFFMTIMTITGWVILALVNDNRLFVYNQIWMPVNINRSPDYEIAFVIQLCAIFLCASIFISIDTMTAATIMCACSQLDIIMDKTKKCVPLSSKLNREEMLEHMEKNYELLVDCIKHHQTVNAFMKLIEDTFHLDVFVQLCDTLLIMSILSYCTANAPTNTVQFYILLNYFFIMLGQLYLYCWCGSELTSRNDDIQDWLYQMPWHEQNLKFNKTLITAMECMKKPIVFRAGHYVPLSRTTFISILRCSYSYFALLRSVSN